MYWTHRKLARLAKTRCRQDNKIRRVVPDNFFYVRHFRLPTRPTWSRRDVNAAQFGNQLTNKLYHVIFRKRDGLVWSTYVVIFGSKLVYICTVARCTRTAHDRRLDSAQRQGFGEGGEYFVSIKSVSYYVHVLYYIILYCIVLCNKYLYSYYCIIIWL